jgi:hypothetical protein
MQSSLSRGSGGVAILKEDDLSDADLILKDLSETTITDIINTIY